MNNFQKVFEELYEARIDYKLKGLTPKQKKQLLKDLIARKEGEPLKTNSKDLEVQSDPKNKYKGVTMGTEKGRKKIKGIMKFKSFISKVNKLTY